MCSVCSSLIQSYRANINQSWLRECVLNYNWATNHTCDHECADSYDWEAQQGGVGCCGFLSSTTPCSGTSPQSPIGNISLQLVSEASEGTSIAKDSQNRCVMWNREEQGKGVSELEAAPQFSKQHRETVRLEHPSVSQGRSLQGNELNLQSGLEFFSFFSSPSSKHNRSHPLIAMCCFKCKKHSMFCFYGNWWSC